jgi:hypothetical protein
MSGYEEQPDKAKPPYRFGSSIASVGKKIVNLAPSCGSEVSSIIPW